MRIAPQPDELTEPYWNGVRQGKLLLQHCRTCGNRWHPPTPICPACQAPDCDWIAASGRGTVYSYTVVHHATHVAVRDQVPYLVALVELEEGPRIVSNIRGRMEEVSIGMKVRVAFETIAGDLVIPQFVPEAKDGTG